MPESITQPEPIMIRKGDVSGGRGINHHILEGCYFYPVGNDMFNFYSSANILLAANLTTKQNFGFSIGPFQWMVADFVITLTGASGTWTAISSNPVAKVKQEAEDEGSFAAQGGGQVDPEKARSASTY
jgi:hypothetical protein